MEGKDITEVCLPILKTAYPQFDWTGYRIIQAGSIRGKDCNGLTWLGQCFPREKIIELYISHEDFDIWFYTLLHEGCHSVTWNGKPPSPKRTYQTAKFRQELDKAEFRSWLRNPDLTYEGEVRR